MRKNIFIKESRIKQRIENFLYGGRSIEKEFYVLLSEIGVESGKYILKNFNEEDGSFDCVNINNQDHYHIRLGTENADGWSHSTIEVTYDGISVNYYYYLNSDFMPSLKIRDFTKTVNGKKITEILNYSLEKREKNAYIRSFKEDNSEAFFYILNPQIEPSEFDEKVLDENFHINWSSIYNLLEKYGNLEHYLIYYKKDNNIVDLSSYGFPIEEVLKHYENSSEKEKTKVRIKNRRE